MNAQLSADLAEPPALGVEAGTVASPAGSLTRPLQPAGPAIAHSDCPGLARGRQPVGDASVVGAACSVVGSSVVGAACSVVGSSVVGAACSVVGTGSPPTKNVSVTSRFGS